MEDHKLSPILFPTSLNEGDSIDRDHFLSNASANFKSLPGTEFKSIRASQREIANKIKMKVGKKDYDPPFWRDRRLLSKCEKSPDAPRSVNSRFDVEFPPSPKSPTSTSEVTALSQVQLLSLSRKMRVLSAVKGEQTKSWH